MKTYVYATDAEIGAVQADSAETVIEELREKITKARGGYAWVENEEGERVYIEWDEARQRAVIQ